MPKMLYEIKPGFIVHANFNPDGKMPCSRSSDGKQVLYCGFVPVSFEKQDIVRRIFLNGHDTRVILDSHAVVYPQLPEFGGMCPPPKLIDHENCRPDLPLVYGVWQVAPE